MSTTVTGADDQRQDQPARYRFDHCGVEPGVQLLLCDSAWNLATGYAAFLDYTGLDAADVYSGPVVATPVPRYDTPVELGRRRWEHVSPEAMWHPLFWLPEAVGGRFVDEEGYVEPEPVWAVRICLEALAAGLYDPDRGWLDVLAWNGLLLEDPDHSARMLNWLAGQPDLLLDIIPDQLFRLPSDSEPSTTDAPEGEAELVVELGTIEPARGGQNWAGEAAASLTGNIQGRAFALIADELLDLMASFPSDDTRATTANTQTVLHLAQACLGDATPNGRPVAEQWTRLELAIHYSAGPWHDAPGEAAVDTTATALIDSLKRVKDYYQPNIELLDQIVDAVDDVDQLDALA